MSAQRLAQYAAALGRFTAAAAAGPPQRLRLRAALDVLEHNGWIRPADPDQGYGTTGREVAKKSPLVRVNPDAATAFTAHRRHPAGTTAAPGGTADTASGGEGRAREKPKKKKK